MPPVTYWTPPSMWKGETAWIIGGGPSLMGLDLTPIHSAHVIGANSAYVLGEWVDIILFSDTNWWQWNAARVQAEYGGIIATLCTQESVLRNTRLLPLKRKHANGLSRVQGVINWNKNTGASCIGLAVQLGVKKIVLLGFDMKVKPEGENNGHHWHSLHKHSPAGNIYERRFLPPFQELQRDLDSVGVEVFNACPDSALSCFQRGTFEEALQWASM